MYRKIHNQGYFIEERKKNGNCCQRIKMVKSFTCQMLFTREAHKLIVVIKFLNGVHFNGLRCHGNKTTSSIHAIQYYIVLIYSACFLFNADVVFFFSIVPISLCSDNF